MFTSILFELLILRNTISVPRTSNVRDSTVYEQVNESLVLYALLSKRAVGEYAQVHILARAFTACVHKVWMLIKTQVNFRHLALLAMSS